MEKHRIWVLLSALAVLLLPFPTCSGMPAPPATVIRCLAVGMDRFVHEENTAPCSANNAETMAGLFAGCLPEGTEVTRRINGPGSKTDMEQLIRETFGSAGENDISFLYLSTHGIAWKEDGAEKTALILSDGEREEALEPETLREMMDRIPGQKVLILDCCHAGAIAGYFTAPEWRVLAGCRAEEECYFWAAGEVTGTGYFTSALENALYASAREQIDSDRNGEVSLKELAERIREIYGVSNAVFLPEEDGQFLFSLPEEQTKERILNLWFESVTEADGQMMLQFHFRTETAVKIEYRLVPMGEKGWDFSRAAKLPDRERVGQKRGVLSPGDKDRSVRISRERLGEGRQALLQIVSFRGLHGQVPVPEATYIIRSCEE